MRFNVMLVLIGIAIVLAALGPGVATCFHTESCLSGSRFWKLVYCASTVMTPPVQAAFLTVGVGGLIAWWYQRANKVMEFRFNTFEKVMNVYSRLSDAGWRFFNHTVLILRSRKEGVLPETMTAMNRELTRIEAELHASLLAAHTILAVNGILFSRNTLDRWGATIRHFEKIEGEDLWAIEDHMYIAQEERLTYIRSVARKIRLRMVEPTPKQIADLERARIALHSSMESVQPKPKPPSNDPDQHSGGDHG